MKRQQAQISHETIHYDYEPMLNAVPTLPKEKFKGFV